jgi:hypothetical protein
MIGERWLNRARQLTQRRLPVSTRLRFVTAVHTRHHTDKARRSLTEQVQERQRSATPGLTAASLPWLHPMQGEWPAALPPTPVPVDMEHRAPGTPAARVSQSSQRRQSPAPQARQLPLRPLPTARVVQPPQTELPQSPMSDTTTEAARVPATVAQSPPLRLEARAQQVLAGVLDIRTPAVNIYANPAADQVARQHRADAVTYGDNILFRAGKYDPTTPQGLGLLSHELTHVAQARRQSAAHTTPPSPDTVAQEEAVALRNEQQVLNRLVHYRTASLAPPPSLPPPASGIGHVPPAPVVPGTPPAPRTAVSDRPINGAGQSGASAVAPALTAAQLQQIKDVVYRDLMERIRTEFERGG